MSKQLRKQNFMAIFMLILVVFILGLLLGKNLNTSDLDEISRVIRNNELDTESYIIEQQLIGSLTSETCDLAKLRFDDMSSTLGNLGGLLTIYENQDQVDEETFNFLKRKYHLLQIKTYLLIDKYLSTCDDESMNIILYYYDRSNESIAQGLILDDLVKDFGITVFAVEFGFSRELNFLQNYYGLSENDLPALIVNRNTTFKKLTSYSDIKLSLNINNTKNNT